MHIDHNQFLELLTETSGIEAEKVEKQIDELIKEINQAVEDGEAYEIEGFGIFSGIGNRILFIPSKELETEINFKYVGMEPIELDEEQVKKEEKPEKDPFSELQELETESDSKRDPFAGLVEDFDEDSSDEEASDENIIFGVEATKKFEGEEEEHNPGPEEWGIEAHKEDDKGANKLLSSLMGEEFSEPEQEGNTDSETEEETSFDDIFGEAVDEDAEQDETESEESVAGLDAELSSLMSEETSALSTDEMEVDDDLSDIFGEEEPEVESLEEEESEEPEAEAEMLDETLDELIAESDEAEEETKTEEPVEKSSTEEIDLDDFDDPFLDLEEELSEDDEEKTEDIVPVITNISSGIEPAKKEEPEPEKKKPVKPKKDSQPAPVWLWIVLALVLITSATVGLGYFSVINIPGITPQVASNITTTPLPPVTTPTPVENDEQPVAPQEKEEVSSQTPPPPPIQEQETVAEVPVSNTTKQVPSGQNKYGIKGVVNEAANDGYTIVLYSLSVEANAFAKQQELTSEGYRALVTPIASEQYGTLWRVSIGQFASLTDAAIASENMDAKFKQSYFIKRITN